MTTAERELRWEEDPDHQGEEPVVLRRRHTWPADAGDNTSRNDGDVDAPVTAPTRPDRARHGVAWSPRLLTPPQVCDAQRLHRLGLFDDHAIATMIGATLEQLHRTFCRHLR